MASSGTVFVPALKPSSVVTDHPRDTHPTNDPTATRSAPRASSEQPDRRIKDQIDTSRKHPSAPRAQPGSHYGRHTASERRAERQTTVPSQQYVDLILDGVDQLLEHVEAIPASAWKQVARHAHSGQADRLALIVQALITAVQIDRGPLLRVALARLTEHAPRHLHHLNPSTTDLVVEAMLSALIAGAMSDHLSDNDYNTLLAPMTLTATRSPLRSTH